MPIRVMVNGKTVSITPTESTQTLTNAEAIKTFEVDRNYYVDTGKLGSSSPEVRRNLARANGPGNAGSKQKPQRGEVNLNYSAALRLNLLSTFPRPSALAKLRRTFGALSATNQ
jgi:hypothetical protein